tara:strand:+ start:7421 stop:7915 length:495 start_codon:yes stop_codon:yes gene_type:complete
MTNKIDVQKNNRRERIEVLGLLDTRNRVENSTLEKSEEGHTKPKRYVNEIEKPSKKFYINRKDSPVRNICEDFTTREEAIKMFDKLLWNSWHACDAMEKPTREWFAKRAKEYKDGKNIDLICDCRRFRGNDSINGVKSTNHPLDCHGYTLKKYIEFLVEKNFIQ